MQNLTRLWTESTRRICLGLMMIALLPGGAALADSYRLEISDKLSVRVVEWQPADLAFAEWTAVGGSYLVGPDGTVSFPFVGEIAASGKTLGELSKDIAEGLRTTLGLTTSPDVSIEIAAFGPVYVLGDVRAPGDFAYAPGLNVMKAVALAGGQRRGEGTTTEKEIISLQGAYEVMHDDYIRLMVHRARLLAEGSGQPDIALPATIETVAAVPAMLAAEQAELQAGLERRLAQARNLDGQAAILDKTLATLEQKRQTTQGQLDLAQEQLGAVQQLVDQGLAVTSRVAVLQGNVADFQSRLLDIDSLQLRAQQDIANLADQRDKLGSDQFIQNSQALQLLEGQLAELELKMATQERLIADAGVSPGAMTNSSFTYTYSILRDGEEMPASPGDLVKPGDVVTATLNIPGLTTP